MLMFEDACGDVNLYVRWSSAHRSPADLAGQVACVLHEAGLLVPYPFIADLPGIRRAGLAGFLAANWAFWEEDESWRAHCRRHYFRPPHPSLSAEQRSAGAVSWGGAP